MHLDVYITHIELYPYTLGDYPVIEKMYTATDKFTGNDFACGFMIEDGKLYLPRGTSISQLESICKVSATYKTDPDPYEKMSRQFYSLYDLKDHVQEEAHEFLLGDEHQLALNLKTGLGKTMVSIYSISKFREKAIIITPDEGLKNQWITTCYKMFDYRAKNLMNISGSNIMNAIMEDYVDEADIYFVNHQTLHNYMIAHGGYALHQFFKKLKVGIKVYDESHLHFANILLTDFFSNTNRTWYLTATFDRSDKTESKCFKRAFNSVISYGETQSYEVIKPHVVYHVVNINSRIDLKEKSKLMGYPGMTAGSYGDYAFFRDPNQTAYYAICEILKKLKNVEGKTLIFVPLISIIEEVQKRIRRDFPDKTVGGYHSKISKDEKESATKKDIIISTIKSLGTGKDIQGLRSVICLEPIASKVTAEQMFGRLRPYAEDKDTYFFDVVDISIPPLNWWFRARFKKYETLAKKIVYLNLDK